MPAITNHLPTSELQALDAAHHMHPFTAGGALAEKGVRVITRANGVYLHDSGGSLRTLQVSQVDVSSSMIRKAVSEGRSIRDLVTDEVLQYIQQRGLYQPQKV